MLLNIHKLSAYYPSSASIYSFQCAHTFTNIFFLKKIWILNWKDGAVTKRSCCSSMDLESISQTLGYLTQNQLYSYIKCNFYQVHTSKPIALFLPCYLHHFPPNLISLLIFEHSQYTQCFLYVVGCRRKIHRNRGYLPEAISLKAIKLPSYRFHWLPLDPQLQVRF